MGKKDLVHYKIIDNSRKIFSHFGFKKTTMTEIADALKKGKSSLYYYFKSKEEVFEAVVNFEYRLFVDELEDAVARDLKPQDKIKNFVIARMKGIQNVSNFHNVIFNQDLGHLRFVKKLQRKYEIKEREILENIFKEGNELDLFRSADSAMLALSMQMALKGMEMNIKEDKVLEKFEENLDNLLNILFYGLLKTN